MEAKETVIDRIGQTINIYKNNFLPLFLPLFIYNFISVVIVGTIMMHYFFSNIGSILDGNIDLFTFLNNSNVVIGISMGMVFFIIYLILYIPVLLGLIKSIKQAYEGTKITTIENLKLGFSNIGGSFKTYWYMFAYVALIPAIIFIIGGLILIYGFLSNSISVISVIGGGIMGLGSIMFIFFALLRGIKASFSIYSATDKNQFTKDNFENSINNTKNNWWRIVGNFLLMGLIILIISGIFKLIMGFITYSGINFEGINNPEDLKKILGDFSIGGQIISGIITNIIKSLTSIFIIIFTYLLYIRLDFENKKIQKKEISNNDKNIDIKKEIEL